jgi:16S rRNA (cytidine1402-2'-O)-methyltransferase
MSSQGTLYLLPSPLASFDDFRWSADSVALEIPALALQLYSRLDYFIVESEKSALRLLSRFKDTQDLNSARLAVFDEHSLESDVAKVLNPIEEGKDGGILSEAGLPCVADPGGRLVAQAHRRGIRVVPISGPSSLMLALSASGLDAQRFMFLGYLPNDTQARISVLRRIANDFQRDGITRIFIETPYRNDVLLRDCIANLPGALTLCVASDLAGRAMRIWTKEIGFLSASAFPHIGKVPAVFLIGKPAGIRPRNTT